MILWRTNFSNYLHIDEPNRIGNETYKENSAHNNKGKAKLDQELVVDDNEEDKMFMGALFNIEHSPAFKFLDQRKARKEVPEKR